MLFLHTLTACVSNKCELAEHSII